MTTSFLSTAAYIDGARPSDVNPRILEAIGRPTIGHLDPLFVYMMDEIVISLGGTELRVGDWGVDDAQVCGLLLNDYNLEIGAGLGVMAGKVWRVGLMGYACRKDNVLKCVSALDEVPKRVGAPVNHGVAMAATLASYGE